MNFAVFEVFPLPFTCKQNKTKGMKERSKLSATAVDRPSYLSSGYSKELSVQNVS